MIVVLQDEIISLLNQVCAALPGLLKPGCDSVVKNYAVRIIETLLKNPHAICLDVGLCKQQANRVVSPLLHAVLSPYDTLPIQPVQPAPNKGNSEIVVLISYVSGSELTCSVNVL